MIKIALIIVAIIVAGWILKKFAKFFLGLIAAALVALILFVGAAAYCGTMKSGSPSLAEQHQGIQNSVDKIEGAIDWIDAKFRK